ncbi:MAG: PepSY domain-containing protein [Pseudomonadota bacterium]
MASSSGRTLLGALVWFHRWTSIVVCLLFAMWFATGAVMLFVAFPSLPADERLAHGEPLDLQSVGITPAMALNAAPDADALRLVSSAGQPIYVASRNGAIRAVIKAGDGQPREEISAAEAGSIAARVGSGRVRKMDADVRYDQWVVHQGFDAGRPYFRVHLDDGAGTVLYVASRTGDVVQKTTRRQRLLNWGGAVLHWIYFTPVRQYWSLWDQLVWWISLGALAGAVTGFILGVYRFVQGRRLRSRGFGVFRGWMRWHHMAGFFAGVFLIGWIFSGWLSMDHGRLFSRADASAHELARFQGQGLASAVRDISLADLQSVGPAGTRELRFGSVGGQGLVIGQGASVGPMIRLAGGSAVLRRLPDSLLQKAGERAWPGSPVSLQLPATQPDLYAQAEETQVDAAVLLVGKKNAQRRLYVDSRSGEILAVADDSRRAYAWAYYALHTYRFPVLAKHDSLRKLLVLIVLAAGFGLSVTGIVLAYRRLSQ